MTVWETPGLLDELKRLCDPEGERPSSSEIANQLSEQFNVRITRNAVIGKCGRLNLALPFSGPAVRSGRVIVRRRKPAARPFRSLAASQPRSTSAARIRLPKFVCEPLPAEDDAGLPIGGGVVFEGLKSDSCRWSFGDPLKPGFVFCGQPIERGHFYSFCAFHLRRAFAEKPAKPAPRRAA